MATSFDPIKQFDDLPDCAIVRVNVALAITGIGRASWWNGVRDGKYPPSVALGPHMVGWRVGDLRQLLDEMHRRATA